MTILRLAPWAGLLGSATVAVASALAAVAFRGTRDELYSPLNHYVSELGRPGVSSLAMLFNAGLIVGGASFAVFMVGLGRLQGGLGGVTYGTLGAVGGIAGLFVGVFPMGTPTLHVVAALVFFNITGIAMALASVDLIVRPNPRIPARLGAVGLAVVAAVIAFNSSYVLSQLADGSQGQAGARPAFDPAATFEWLAVVGVVAWTASVAAAWARAERAFAR